MKLEYPLHPSEPCRIVEEALNTLGLDFHFLALLTGTELGYVERRLVSPDLGVREWISLCDALLLNTGCYSYGYIFKEHYIRIDNAILDGYFKLPKTRRFWALRFKHWKNVIRNIYTSRKHYGFRLYWSIHFSGLKEFILRRIARKNQSYDPLEKVREAFYTDLKMHRHIFKNDLLLKKVSYFDTKCPSQPIESGKGRDMST